MSQLKYKKSAVKFLENHRGESQAKAMVESFKDLVNDWYKFSKIYDIKRMSDRKPENEGFHLYRLRQGKYRAIFEQGEKGEIIIIVIDIDSRGGIYK